MSHYVIEMQGFRGKEASFIVKELTMIDAITGKIITNVLITSPYSFSTLSPKDQRVVKYVSFNINHLRWDDGISTINHVKHSLKKILKMEDRIYTKGDLKAKFLSSLLKREVIELGSYLCPSLKQLRDIEQAQDCPYHWNPKHVCALTSARCVAKWLNGHLADNKSVTPTQ